VSSIGGNRNPPAASTVESPTVFAYYPQSQFHPCPDCGAPVPEDHDEAHRCDRRRLVEYQMLLLRPEIVAFEDEVTAWLRTPLGRFEAYYAARERLLAA
jgi:NAD-dependent SIR2 family protein deacetylase